MSYDPTSTPPVPEATEILADEALIAEIAGLLAARAELKEQADRATEGVKGITAQLEKIIDRSGRKSLAALDTAGVKWNCTMVDPTIRQTLDKDKLRENLLTWLGENCDMPIAEAAVVADEEIIGPSIKESVVKGSLRISEAK